MLDEQDQGTRIGVGVALGIVLLLVIGLLGWLTMRGGKAPVPAAKPAAVMAAADAFIDSPLAGEKIASLYFAVGESALPADAASAIAAIKNAADAAPAKKLVLSGFHDTTGDPATNAELAKNRAKAVRTALQGTGIAAERIALRKPESTAGGGNDQEARRVEVRLVD
jgi:outer membrane protein OmpA-like peptidoglycan-associated protein